ncbi:MAG: LppX_LprAFG lipoprotein [Ilumatobacteraceae bacterium]
MTTRRRPDGPVLFAELMLVAAATALVAVVAFAFRSTEPAVFADADDGGSGDAEVVDLDDGAVADPDADVDEVVAAAAEAMGEVTSVEFRLDRDGAPIYIDEFESLALDSRIGQFTVPNQARAQLTDTDDGNLTTEIAAVAIDDEVWISNPVTGDFETLPPGFDIDPSRFFDPEDGWQPLLANLRDVELVGIDDRGGERYHVRGVAPASEVENITVGLVDGQDVPVDLWIHPGTHLVTHLEFSTTIDGADSQWVLDLDRYGESFTIRPPANVRTGVDS